MPRFSTREIDSHDRETLIASAYNALGILRAPTVCRQLGTSADEDGTVCAAGQCESQTAAGMSSADGSQDVDAHALALFRRAHALVPGDTTIACNRATATRSLDQGLALGRLRNDLQTQLALFRSQLGAAVDQADESFFRAALAACERALGVAPLNAAALLSTRTSSECGGLRTSAACSARASFQGGDLCLDCTGRSFLPRGV